MADESHILYEREKALEEQFFAKHNEELKRRLREKRDKEQMREALRRIAAVTREETIDRMLELGITADTWVAISMVPLVEVAWANGRVDAKERRAVLAAAEANGVTPGSASHEILQSWLDHRPDGRLLETWGEYIVALCSRLTAEERSALRDEVMGRARQIAKATGGFLGLGNRVSREEEVVLEDLAKAFEDR